MRLEDILSDMRAWVMDCEWIDDPSELPSSEIARGVERHYEGGIASFIAHMASCDSCGMPATHYSEDAQEWRCKACMISALRYGFMQCADPDDELSTWIAEGLAATDIAQACLRRDDSGSAETGCSEVHAPPSEQGPSQADSLTESKPSCGIAGAPCYSVSRADTRTSTGLRA